MIADTRPCGHPRTPENTSTQGGKARCRICCNEYQRRYRKAARTAMTESDKLARRVKAITTQIRRAREHLAVLEAEALQYGFTDLVGIAAPD